MASVRTDKVQLELNIAAEQARTELDNLSRKQQILIEEQKQMRKGTEEYIKSNKELKEVNSKIADLRKDLGLTGMSLNQLEKLTKELNRELKGLTPGTETFIAKSKELQEVENRASQVKKAIKGIDEELNKSSGGFSEFAKKALAFTGINMGVEAVVDTLVNAGTAVKETVQEFQKMRSDINSLTGATGEDLDGLATSIRAISQTFDKDYNEVLIASNALAKQMGIGQQEAINLIEKGFVAGADASGEFLDQLREYPGQFKEAGLSASEMIAVITQSTSQGVFSDKGADVVKEFGLRIREQTPAVQEALEGAFGEEFTGKLFKGLNDGSVSTVDALKLVSEGLNNTELTAAQAQLVIADVFGGPGEDAGMDYLLSLQNIGAGVDDLIDKNNVFIQRQQTLLASEKELAAAQNELSQSFDSGSTTLETLTNEGLTFLYTLLTGLIGIFADLFAPISRMWGALGSLAESMGLVSKEGSLLKTVSEILVGIFKALVFPIQLAFDAISGLYVAISEFVQESPSLRFAVYQIIAPFQALFDLFRNAPALLSGLQAAFKQAFSNIAQLIKLALSGDMDGLTEFWKNRGASVSDAFNKAYAAEQKKGQDARTKSEQEQTEKELAEKKKAADAITAEEKKARDKAAEERRKEREKEAQEREKAELDAARKIADLRNGIIVNEYERKVSLLKTQRDRDLADARGSVTQIDEQKKLINQKYALDKEVLDKEKAAKEEKIAEDTAKKITDIRHKALLAYAEFEVITAKNAGVGVLAAKMAQLDVQKQVELENANLTAEEKLLIEAQYQERKKELAKQTAEETRKTEVEQHAFAIGQFQVGVQTYSDFKKIASDRELLKEDKDKERRLKNLESEYKAGRVSKETYESQKTAIETNYDQKARSIKRQAAEDEKKANIAQSIMAGILAVIKAGPLTPMGIATGIAAALATAKIIATPVPTFGKGGMFGNLKRMFSSGGKINPVAGVPSVGQLHSNGGIKMVDGATGEYLGEWERDEPYMILSRETYKNNGPIIDSLLDSSLHRGGAPVKMAKGGIYEDGGITNGSTVRSAANQAKESSGSIISELRGIRQAVESKPDLVKAYVVLTEVESGLSELQEVRDDAAA